jgi:hypothetical protein
MPMVGVRIGDDLARKLREKAGSGGVGRVLRGLIEAWVSDSDVKQPVSNTEPVVKQHEMPKIRGMVKGTALVSDETPPEGCPCGFQVRGGVCGAQAVRWHGNVARCGEH